MGKDNEVSIKDVQDQIIEEFSFFDNWEEKYSYIIDLGKSLSKLSDNYKIEENKIKGCQSQVWLVSNFENGKVYFEGDSDALIVKGLVSMLIRVYSGQTPDDIISNDLRLMNEIGLQQHLSPTRSNGLASMLKQIKYHALAYKTKE